MNLGRVYMIISPCGRIYVGSTTRNFKERWEDYISLNCKSQIRLYNSFIKYGVKNHKFYKVWIGNINDMLMVEAKLGRIWNVLDRNLGLNCQLPKESDIYSCISEDTRKKMSISAKNKPPISIETKLKMSNSLKNPSLETRQKMSNSRKGMKHSQETKDKIGRLNKGRKLSEAHKLKLSQRGKGLKTMLGKNHSDKTKKQMSLAKKGIKQSENHRNKINKALKKAIIQMDLEGIFIKEWQSGKEAAEELKISSSHISECCTNKRVKIKQFKFKYKQNE